MTNKLWCGFPDKHWKGSPDVCRCGWVFPYKFHANKDGSWPELPHHEPRPRRRRERLEDPPPRKRERLDLFDID